MTATASKPKAPRTIVKTVVTTSGVKTELSKSATDQITRTMELCSMLRGIPILMDKAAKAYDALDTLMKAAV
jgi:hypothetical protein